MLLFDYLKYQYYKWKLKRLSARVLSQIQPPPFKWKNFKGVKTKEEEIEEINELLKEWDRVKNL